MPEKNRTDLPRRELTVGEVATRSGVAVSTLHFYETKGLIKSMRSRGNQRRYPRSVLRRIAVIKIAQRTGIPLADIQKELSALPNDRQLLASDWAHLSEHWKADLNERIAKFDTFAKDPDRARVFGQSERNGPIVEQVTVTILRPAAFSPMK